VGSYSLSAVDIARVLEGDKYIFPFNASVGPSLVSFTDVVLTYTVDTGIQLQDLLPASCNHHCSQELLCNL
jgi:hypothetical protein